MHNYSYRPSAYTAAHIGSADSLVKVVKPDINGAYASAKAKRNLFVILIPVCMILFMGGGVLMGVTGVHSINTAFLPVMLLGFFGFGASGALVGFFGSVAAKIQMVITLKNEIQVQDKTNLDDLTLSKYIGKNSVILIINELMKTDNLSGYELIGNVGIAKTELRAKERDFGVVSAGKAAKEESVQRIFKCPSCGAAITEKTGKFCTFCGTRLE